MPDMNCCIAEESLSGPLTFRVSAPRPSFAFPLGTGLLALVLSLITAGAVQCWAYDIKPLPNGKILVSGETANPEDEQGTRSTFVTTVASCATAVSADESLPMILPLSQPIKFL